MFATLCRVRINDGLAPARPFGVRDGGVPAIIEGPALLGPGPAQLREARRVREAVRLVDLGHHGARVYEIWSQKGG